MVQVQKHRAPKLKNVQRVYEEGTPPVLPKAIPLHKEDQAVEEKQSYAMITGLLQILVASIVYQRDLFPKSCFEMRLPSLTCTKAHPSNITSSDDDMAHFATALAQRDRPFVVLAPSRTNGVDKLLAWLDEIFQGLLDHSLDGFQFSIYADKSRPSEILELYTFSFQYRHGKDGERLLMGLTAPSGGSGMVTTRSVRSGMLNVIDQLNSYQQQLPALPKERYLMCHLFHSPYAPRNHQSPGFHECMDTTMAVIENRSWYMKQRSLGSTDTGNHRMRLELSFMVRTDAGEDLDHRPVIAQNMEYSRTVSRTLKPNLERGAKPQAAPPEGGTESSGRWTSSMRRTTSPKPLSKDSGDMVRIHDTSRGSSLLPTQVMEAHDPPALLRWNWKLRAGKEMEMGVKREKQQWIAAWDDRVVRCECSCDLEERPMLQCTCCQKLQHYHCYGFALETQVNEHHCYHCLLEDTHRALLEDMKSIAIFRRALWILYEENPSSPAEFAQKLHLDGKTTRGLIDRLDEGGYLASGRTQLSPVTTPEQLRFRSQLYHNPLTSIGGFYEPREDTPPASPYTDDGNFRRKRIKI